MKQSAPGHQRIYATYPKGIFSTTTDKSWNRPEVAAEKQNKFRGFEQKFQMQIVHIACHLSLEQPSQL